MGAENLEAVAGEGPTAASGKERKENVWWKKGRKVMANGLRLFI